jgi:HEAT repeat protein
MKKHKELTPRQLRALEAIVETVTIEEASKVSRISRSRIYAWLREPTFRERLEAARMELFRSGLEKLKTAVPSAIDVLSELLSNKDPQARRLAAVAVIQFGFRAAEIGDLERRITRLEEESREGRSLPRFDKKPAMLPGKEVGQKEI